MSVVNWCAARSFLHSVTTTMTRSGASSGTSGAAGGSKPLGECAFRLRRHTFDISESMSNRRVSQLQHRAAESSNKGGTMRKRIWSATCGAIALGLTIGLAAQQPPDNQSPAKRSSAKSITETGLIQQVQQAPTGTSGTAGAT